MLEQMYQDFTMKLLPKISDGLVISKEYFADLFGRYVKYLIVIDSLEIVVCLVSIFLPLFLAYKYRKYIIDTTEGALFMCLLFLVIPIMFLFESTEHLIKDIYIPEVRIYEEIKNFNK